MGKPYINSNQTTNIYTEENAFENIACKMPGTILFLRDKGFIPHTCMVFTLVAPKLSIIA